MFNDKQPKDGGNQPMMSEVKIRESRYEGLKKVAEDKGTTVQNLIDEALERFLIKNEQ